MAQGKKSFVLYIDLINQIDHLTNEEKGILFQHLLEYVNDLNPILEDRVLLSTWKPIELQLKRDLKLWEKKQKQRIEAGKKSAASRKAKSTDVNGRSNRSTNSTVNVNGNVTVNDNVNNKSVIYETEDFLKIWNQTRTSLLKKPSNVNRLSYMDKNKLNDILHHYDLKDVKNAMYALFKQENIEFTSMHSSPSHFLEHFEKYHQAFLDKDLKLYGSKQQKNTNQESSTNKIPLAK